MKDGHFVNRNKQMRIIMYSNMIIRTVVFICFAISAPLLMAQQTQYNMISGVVDLNMEMPEKNSAANALLIEEIELNLTNVNLEQALTAIAEQADLKLMYSKELLTEEKQVTLNNRILTVYEALWTVLEGTGLQFAISENGQLVLLDLKDNETKKESIVQEVITGNIVETGTDEPLPGVNVVIENTSTGTSTDVDGNFSLTVPSLNETLVVSYIGYETQEIPINGRTSIDIELTSSVVIGSEMVVTAFGVARERASVGYSVTEISGEGLTKSRETNVANSLTGKIAGVNATGMASGPGASSRIIIRGVGSLSGNNQPLYVVNGMPISNQSRDLGTQGSTMDRGDGISSINPDDIETISVLKGGAAAGLYGSQAANGVILITTKQGATRQEGIGIELSSNFTIGTISVFPDYQQEYGQGANGVRPQTQEEAITTGRLSFGEKVDGQPYVQFDGVERPYTPTNAKQNYKNYYSPSINISNTVAISGNTDMLIYRLSLSDLNAESVLPETSLNRKTANMSLTAMLTDKLSTNAVVQYNYEVNNNRPHLSYAPGNQTWAVNLLANTVDIRDLAPGYDSETGEEVMWQHVAEATNPYFVRNKWGNNDTKNRVLMQGSVTYDILPNLYVKGDFMRDFESFESEDFVPVGTSRNPNGFLRTFDDGGNRTNARVIMEYDTPVSEQFNVSLMMGGNIERISNSSVSIDGEEFVVDNWISPLNARILTTSKGLIRSGTNSLFGSTDMNFREIFYLNLTGRQDWFSTLNPGNNSIFYPSIGGSFVLTNAFQLPEIINFARVRTSWAQVGAATVQPYDINQTYGFLPGGHMGAAVQTTSSSLANSDLRPLRSTTIEAGFDLELMNGRFAIDLSLYDRLTEDDIVSSSVPVSSGSSSTILNVGEISNKGIELLLTAEPVRSSNFSWRTSYNLGYNKNEVLTLAPGETRGGTSLLGRSLSTYFGRDFETTEDGTRVYDSISNYERDVTIPLGKGVPPYTMGLSNTFFYNNFSLDILLDGKFGNHFFSQHQLYAHRFGLAKETLSGRESGLSVSGVDENGNSFSHTWPTEQLHTYYNRQGRYDSLFLMDGSFIKLRSLVLGYNFPIDGLNFLNLQSAEISLVGRNLMTLYKKTKNFDPEQGFQPDVNEQNFAGSMLPATRNIGLNLNVRF